MKYRSIVRVQNGYSRRLVQIKDIVVPDVRTLGLFFENREWWDLLAVMYDDLIDLLHRIEIGAQLPPELFIPNVWSIALELPEEECELLLDFWRLGHDLAIETAYDAQEGSIEFRRGVLGTLYRKTAD